MSQIERRNKKLTLKGLKYRLDKNKKLKCDLINQNLMSDLTAKNLNNLKSSVEAQVSDVSNVMLVIQTIMIIVNTVLFLKKIFMKVIAMIQF
jgi:hypothetical protein